MIEVVATNIENILQDFLDDKNLNISEIIKDNPQLFKCRIKYEKYNQSVTGPVAKIICEYQSFVYQMASYLKYGKKDIRCLLKEEKEQLEVVFAVKKGSSDLFGDFYEQAMEVLNMIPEDQRGIVLIVFIIFFFGYKAYSKYSDNKKEQKEKELIENAMDKIASKDDGLIEILKNTEKNLLNTLPDIDSSIEYQGEIYTSEDFKKIKNAKYPRIKSEKKLASLEGNFVVTQINIKKHYILIEDENEEPKKILYNDDLVAGMQGFKDKFKEAIDEEGKVFYIRAGYVTQNNHPKDLCLYDIQEKNDK